MRESHLSVPDSVGLSYASMNQPRFKRLVIRSIEEMSGRRRYERLYALWRSQIPDCSDQAFSRMLDMVEVRLQCLGHWPPRVSRDPLVMVANHPFGIGDGLAMLSMAEQLSRPFRVMIHADLLKIEEVRPYALPVRFDDSREAATHNMRMRHEALDCLRRGVTVICFPAGGVATAPRGLGRAEDLPWKMFPARLVRDARASVLPVYFPGQNGRLFHLASLVSQTLRTSLLIHEFTRLRGRTITAVVGEIIDWPELSGVPDRTMLRERLRKAVFDLAPAEGRTDL